MRFCKLIMHATAARWTNGHGEVCFVFWAVFSSEFTYYQLLGRQLIAFPKIEKIVFFAIFL